MGDTLKPTKKPRRKLKRLLVVLSILTVAFFSYVEIANKDSKNMTYRQKLLKAVYPAWMWVTKLTGKNTTVLANTARIKPPQSFYDLSLKLNNGKVLDCSTLMGKKVLLVNTASDCGYTNQYGDLQQLQNALQDKLVIIGFPANDFKEQEKGTDESIGEFCTVNFGVTFPLATKTVVIKKDGQSPIFQWLTDKSKNGWNDHQPDWNFCKYLINESGMLTHYFSASVTPGGKEIKAALAQ
jgi:glutathione peroxidase